MNFLLNQVNLVWLVFRHLLRSNETSLSSYVVFVVRRKKERKNKSRMLLNFCVKKKFIVHGSSDVTRKPLPHLNRCSRTWVQTELRLIVLMYNYLWISIYTDIILRVYIRTRQSTPPDFHYCRVIVTRVNHGFITKKKKNGRTEVLCSL